MKMVFPVVPLQAALIRVGPSPNNRVDFCSRRAALVCFPSPRDHGPLFSGNQCLKTLVPCNLSHVFCSFGGFRREGQLGPLPILAESRSLQLRLPVQIVV